MNVASLKLQKKIESQHRTLTRLSVLAIIASSLAVVPQSDSLHTAYGDDLFLHPRNRLAVLHLDVPFEADVTIKYDQTYRDKSGRHFSKDAVHPVRKRGRYRDIVLTNLSMQQRNKVRVCVRLPSEFQTDRQITKDKLVWLMAGDRKYVKFSPDDFRDELRLVPPFVQPMDKAGKIRSEKGKSGTPKKEVNEAIGASGVIVTDDGVFLVRDHGDSNTIYKLERDVAAILKDNAITIDVMLNELNDEIFSSDIKDKDSISQLEDIALLDKQKVVIGEAKESKAVLYGKKELATYNFESLRPDSKNFGIEGLDIVRSASASDSGTNGYFAAVLWEGNEGKKADAPKEPHLYVHRLEMPAVDGAVKSYALTRTNGIAIKSEWFGNGNYTVRGTAVLFAEVSCLQKLVPAALVLVQARGKNNYSKKWLAVISLESSEGPQAPGQPSGSQQAEKPLLIDLSELMGEELVNLNWEGMCWLGDNELLFVNDNADGDKADRGERGKTMLFRCNLPAKVTRPATITKPETMDLANFEKLLDKSKNGTAND